MSVSRISSRYAKSLMELALDRNELEAIKKDILYFTDAMRNRDLYLLLKSPIINAGKKLSIIKTVFGNKVGSTTMAFFEIIIKKGREMYLPEIAADFIGQYKLYNKISTIKITTASPLSQDAMNDIKSKLLASNITMEKLEVTEKVDPSIIGGFIIEAGDKLYDASIAHKLEEMKKNLSGNQFVKTF
ncbi:MAG: ATP synthase F1 subunit delta [Saprospiraceae bacterium]|jgi:F-type H+-transporting ATPase subunit delta|nr:ATP synthase F1 subunit delta [Saprospiraceae bacterium]